ncbi:porin family protein [Cellvibrio sp.]|uniref:porin family protein n=1 Tax=Cellvibrio sp. TaxID=1965322 RepID=UPI00396482C7
MKKILVAAIALSAATSYADTSSFSGFYVGGGVSSVRNDLDDTKWSPAELFGGYKLNPYVGGEVRVGASFEGDSKITNYESFYYRTESANSVGKSYLLLGYSHAVIDTFSGDYTLNGMSYGAGVGFVISEKFNLNLEYKVLANGKGGKANDKEEDIKLSSVSATVDYRF